MQDVALLHETQAEEHLLGVCSDSAKIDTHIPTELLQNLAQVDTQVLKYHAEMILVLKRAFQADHVLLVFRICLIDLLEDLDLLGTCLTPIKGQYTRRQSWRAHLHCLVVANYFDSNQLH